MSEKQVNKKERIIQEAHVLLVSRGLKEVSMGEIAEASGCTRRTLYRYFPSKDELIFEVLIRILEEWNRVQDKLFSMLSGSGSEQLESYLKELVAYMAERMDMMRFLGAFDFYFQDQSDVQCSHEVKERFNQASHGGHRFVYELVQLGISDGSISYDGDFEVLVSTISQVLWSFGQRIALRGGQIEEEDHISRMKLIACQIDLYLKALRVV